MTDHKERAELLAALHAAGAASEEDERELEALLEAGCDLLLVSTTRHALADVLIDVFR